MATLTAKNYSQITCPMCDGAGRGVTKILREAWICSSCDGTGHVSKYPPKPDIWAGYSTRTETL